MNRVIHGWAMEDDDGFMWIDIPPESWCDYDKKFYNATLTIDLDCELKIIKKRR
jgi:hypothetical protein